MIRLLSIRIDLEKIIKDRDFEKKVLENLRRCNKLLGKLFQVVFKHSNLTEDECKDFIMRNEDLLFEINTKITKEFEPVWFLIDPDDEDECQSRYKYKGEILRGIVEYLQIAKKIVKDMDENSNHR